MDEKKLLFTCTSPVNIAVIKYWGKRDEKLILPLNDSLSLTLHQKDLRSKTTVLLDKELKQDELWLNGEKQEINNQRIQNVLVEIRTRSTKNSNLKAKIVSENNFPTAAGLASSASGYCCLVYTLAQAYSVEGELSTIARIGSGSACRSMYGGFVKWCSGELENGTDSKAVQIKEESFWSEIQILVCIVNKEKKETSSTSGMKESVKTSELLKERVKFLPQRIKEIEEAISNKNFEKFGEITMKDSDNFHDICKDTKPSIVYLNDTSRKIINFVHAFNNFSGKIKIAYTFDAGPNAMLMKLYNF
eukprot:gene6443-10450_t